MEFSLLGAAALALACAAVVLWWEGRTEGGVRERFDLVLSSAVAGLAVGRIAAMIGGGTNPFTHPGDLLILRGGVDTGFAAAGALAAAIVLSRVDVAGRLDAVAAAALAGLAGWHGGCVLRGACAGTPTSLPWGITEQGGPVARHPVEAYAAVLLAAGAVALVLWRRRGAPAGTAAGAALAWAAAVRLATEPMRVGLGAGPEWWYVVGLSAGAASVVWSMVAGRAQP
ncbi:MAG: prolipoprotein diacylglyceryl transferase [Actinobacteria bacterium]|nr:prolipoprotein diacylglyceryl transferase [Actinomycetota bacterium]